MTRITKWLKGIGEVRHAAVASAEPRRELSEAELDKVAAAGGRGGLGGEVFR